MAIVRLHCKKEDGSFKEANLRGILCFIVDRKLKSRFFRLFDINTSELLFQTELYVNFGQHYTYISEKNYCFPLVKTVLGIEFANLNDALYFQKLIDKFCFIGDPHKAAKEEKKMHGVAQYRLTTPTNFKQKSQNGWNPVTQTFSIKDCPKEFIQLLKKAGFKKKQLKKHETALQIYQYLLANPDFEQDMLTKDTDPAQEKQAAAA